MSEVFHSSTEIQFNYESFTQNYSDGTIDIVIKAKNPFFNACSVGEFKFKSQSTDEWLPCTAYGTQEEDLTEMPLTGAYRLITIRWDAGTDLRIMQAWTNVEMSLTLYDRPDSAGAETHAELFTVSSVDFTINDISSVVHPTSNDPFMEFEFYHPTTIRDGVVHFRIDVDTVETFDSANLESFDTDDSTTDWQEDDSAFPEIGTDGTSQSKIELSNSTLTNLPDDTTFYYQIVPKVDQFYAVVDSPSNNQVFIGTSVTISGTVEVLDD